MGENVSNGLLQKGTAENQAPHPYLLTHVGTLGSGKLQVLSEPMAPRAMPAWTPSQTQTNHSDHSEEWTGVC